MNPPSLTGRRPDASATSLCARWSGAREAGVSGGSGLEHDRRARTRVACFSQAVGTARRGLATTRRRRKGARRGTASAQTRHAYPSHRSDSLGSASSTSESEDSSESDSALAVGDLAGAGTPSAALIALGSKPRGASARGGRAHERAPAVSRRRANAAFRSVSRWTRAPPYRAELKCGAQEIFLRAFKAQGGAEELKPKETHVSGCLPIQVGEAGPTAGARSESTIRVASCGFRDVACRLSPPRALLRARVTQPLATQET